MNELDYSSRKLHQRLVYQHNSLPVKVTVLKTGSECQLQIEGECGSITEELKQEMMKGWYVPNWWMKQQ